VNRRLASVCVQCGSHPGASPAFAVAARELGRVLAGGGVRVIHGGLRTGLMGAVADAALAAGGCVVGVAPRFLVDQGIGHERLTELRVVDSMQERKSLMLELSEAAIMLPGGVGTQDEFWETLAGAQLGLHAKPCGILNVDGYYDWLFTFMDRALAEGFLSASDRRNVLVNSNVEQLVTDLSERVFEDSEAAVAVQKGD